MLVSIVLRFCTKMKNAFGGAKPSRIAPGVLRKRLISQRRSANWECKTQGVLSFPSAKRAVRGVFSSCQRAWHPGVPDSGRMNISDQVAIFNTKIGVRRANLWPHLSAQIVCHEKRKKARKRLCVFVSYGHLLPKTSQDQSVFCLNLPRTKLSHLLTAWKTGLGARRNV
jgi:hypothetical protein